MSEVALRRLETPDELRACEDLQVAVWGYTDREVVPKNELLAAVRSGGSAIGAFRGGELVGFAYGMAGLDGEGPFLSSRLLAVLSDLRGKGVGERLKRAQREHALELGYGRIRWTQDPLQAANARLNFRKLGALARRYVVDYYGETTSPLHGSLPTDRLEVEWPIASLRVRRRLGLEPGVSPGEVPEEGEPASVLDAVAAPGSALVRPGEPRDPPAGARRLSLSVPSSLGEVLERDRALALAWRLAAREAFRKAFERGFEASDFLPGNRGEGRYLLTCQAIAIVR